MDSKCARVPPGLEEGWPCAADQKALRSSRALSTVVARNLPCRATQSQVLAAISGMGFDQGDVEFFYMPSKPGKDANLGYCFVGFRGPALADLFRQRALGYTFPQRESRKQLYVEYSRLQTLQEFAENFAAGGKRLSNAGVVVFLGEQGDSLLGQRTQELRNISELSIAPFHAMSDPSTPSLTSGPYHRADLATHSLATILPDFAKGEFLLRL